MRWVFDQADVLDMCLVTTVNRTRASWGATAGEQPHEKARHELSTFCHATKVKLQVHKSAGDPRAPAHTLDVHTCEMSAAHQYSQKRNPLWLSCQRMCDRVLLLSDTIVRPFQKNAIADPGRFV